MTMVPARNLVQYTGYGGSTYYTAVGGGGGGGGGTSTSHNTITRVAKFEVLSGSDLAVEDPLIMAEEEEESRTTSAADSSKHEEEDDIRGNDDEERWLQLGLGWTHSISTAPVEVRQPEMRPFVELDLFPDRRPPTGTPSQGTTTTTTTRVPHHEYYPGESSGGGDSAAASIMGPPPVFFQHHHPQGISGSTGLSLRQNYQPEIMTWGGHTRLGISSTTPPWAASMASTSLSSSMMPFYSSQYSFQQQQQQQQQQLLLPYGIGGFSPASFEAGGPSSDIIRVIDAPRRPQAGIWFFLQASQNQRKEPTLPQIPKSYLRIKDGRMTVRLLMKYLANKLGLNNESEVEITCKGQLLSTYMTLQHVRDNIWCSRDAITLLPDSSTTDHVMVLRYGRSG